MAAKKYTCTNFANCDAALSKQVIEIEEGEDVICPTCNGAKTLAPAGGGGSKASGPPKALVFGAGGLVVVLLLAWMLWPQPPADPNTLLTEFFPRLQ